MSTYQKPLIKSKKIKVSFFMGTRFFDSMNAMLVPPVFAASGGPGCAGGICSNCGFGGCGSCGSNCGECWNCVVGGF